MNNMTDSLIKLFERDLEALKKELNLYESESDMWKVKASISNSGGNLCLHIVGNLLHFVGHVIGGSDYVRNRPAEFELKSVPLKDLLDQVETTRIKVIEVLKNLNNDDLERKYPIDVLKYEMTTGYFLIHLYGHLNYHLGQVNYHRRMI